MTPSKYYQNQIKNGLIQEDLEQWRVIQHLDRVYYALIQEARAREGWRKWFHKPQSIQGLYVWGGVGIGKTFMMDCFFKSLPFQAKLRLHFHHFMQRVHAALKTHQGEVDPLQAVAADFAANAIVLCFDEFFVSDITDAMILGRLLKALFDRGVSLVTTSNLAPDDLYKNGLQRLQFLPAIALIKAKTDVCHVPSIIDYRIQHLKEAGVFYSPLDAIAAEKMEKTFKVMSNGQNVETKPIVINHRRIRIIKESAGVIWFDFADICSIPRSQNDYLELVKKYHTIFISQIPKIPEKAIDTLRLFVNLVDVCYDARIKLVISAEENVPDLYDRGQLILEFARTQSRLLEMQSLDYFNNEDI